MKYSKLLSSTLVALLIPAADAWSATASDVATDSGAGVATLEEIVVTAQKREQKLTDVAMSITAISADQIQQVGVHDVSELPVLVPGLTVGKQVNGYLNFSIRGVNFAGQQFSSPSAVSIYMDEAAFPYSAMASGSFFDMERVEVLKGPQGTLYGQNSTGGAINLIAAKPTRTFSVGTDLEVNNYGQIIGGGYVSGPVTDTLAMRFSATTTQLGAWQHGYYLWPGQRNGDQNLGGARLLADWKPVDDLKVSFNLNANYDDSEPQLPQTGSVNATAVAPQLLRNGVPYYQAPTNDREAEQPPGDPLSQHNSNAQGVIRVDYRFSDAAKVTSITDYITSKYNRVMDNGSVGTIIAGQTALSHSISEELRLAGLMLDSRLNYVVGVNYESDSTDEGQFPQGYYNLSGVPVGTTLDAAYKFTNKTEGVFADLDYEVVSGLTLTGGIRYTHTKQGIDGCMTGNDLGSAFAGGLYQYFYYAYNGAFPTTNPYVPGSCLTINNTAPQSSPDFLQPLHENQTQSENNVPWRVGVNYKPTTDSLIYALVSRGFKAGQFPLQDSFVATQIQPVKQEEVTSFEVGTKATLLNGRLQANAAYFHYDYNDKQFFSYVPTPIYAVVTVVNIPKSKEDGAELGLTAIPIDGLTVHADVTYIHTRVGNYVGFNPAGAQADYTGDSFNFAPPWTGSADAEYRRAVTSGLDGFVGAHVLYNDLTNANIGSDPKFAIPSYAIFDVRTGIQSKDGWAVSAYVRNLSDKYYWTSVVANGDVNIRYAGMPRTFGLSLTYRY
jgi:outer membrane receptor protein involved in Fe transport